MSLSNRNVLRTYKDMVKALVRSERRSRIIQKKADIKCKISVLTYDRMQIVREQNQLKDLKDPRIKQEQIKLIKKLNELNHSVENLKEKKINIEKDKSLLFLQDSSPFKQLFQTELLELIKQKKTADEFQRIMESWKDATSFLNNQREYDELMELYNLSNKYTQREKVQATAHRVGLNVPF